MLHNHKHDHCAHAEVKFCSHCNVVYCKACNKEWNSSLNWSLNQQYAQPAVQWKYANGIGDLLGGAVLTAAGTKTNSVGDMKVSHTHS